MHQDNPEMPHRVALPPLPAATRRWRSALLASAVLIALFMAGAVAIRPDAFYPGNLLFLARHYALGQDVPVAIGFLASWLACLFAASRSPLSGRPSQSVPILPNALLAFGLLAMVLGCWWLRETILFDFDLSRDEQMARFDAAILAGGQLFAPAPSDWQTFHDALNTLFILPVPGHGAWVSNYLPGNAALLALGSVLLPAALVAPLLTGIAGLSLWSITARLWPESAATRSVVLLLFAGSAQVWLTATTTFAMSAHLACNGVWLALFLRDRPWAHAMAMVTALLATGLHQPLFHPLFAGPVLLTTLLQKRYRLFGAYTLAYGAIGLFWLAWPGWVAGLAASSAAGAGPAITAGEPVTFFERLDSILRVPHPTSLWIEAANALRFVSWQHVLALPLAILGSCVAWRRREALPIALATGILALFLVMTLLLPLQGHGYGYRYAHGLIPSLCLLGGYGWNWLEGRKAAPPRAIVLASLASLCILLPVRVVMAQQFLAPLAALDRKVAQAGSDIVVVEDEGLLFGDNLVINRSDLSNRPVRLLASKLSPRDITRLCNDHRIAFVDARQMTEARALYGHAALPSPGEHMASLVETARLHCKL
ncbi:hypothetical protein [Novosphingobium aureum]|nr:hypothetical protein [Novosphingobium aureum]